MGTILVIEDSAYQRGKLSRMLGEAGYELAEAASGEEGLGALETVKPDCIVLDLLMPGMGGIGFLEAYGDRKDRVPVVVLTADIQDTTRERCLALGAVAFLNKPTRKEALLSTLDETIGAPPCAEGGAK